jgi:hypothetical protein
MRRAKAKCPGCLSPFQPGQRFCTKCGFALAAHTSQSGAPTAPTGLLGLTPRQFESAVAVLLRKRGYRDVQLVGGAGDRGVDIRCRDRDGHLVIVQCKRYSPNRPIGDPAIQHFFGMMVHHGAARGIFVTTSRFTLAARNLARQRGIELINGSDADLVRHIRAGHGRAGSQEERKRGGCCLIPVLLALFVFMLMLVAA